MLNEISIYRFLSVFFVNAFPATFSIHLSNFVVFLFTYKRSTDFCVDIWKQRRISFEFDSR